MTSAQGRRWIFTLNNPIGELKTDFENIRYCIYQLEKGKDGTLHYQGYVEFNKQIRLAGIKKQQNQWERMHLEIAKGTQEECIKYCTKEETRIEEPIEHGERAKAGKKSTASEGLNNAINMIKDKRKISEVAMAESTTFVKYFKGLERLATVTSTKREWKTKGWVFYGPTNVGKSHLADYMFPNAYHLTENGKRDIWFDGYDGEESIIVDDFYGWMPMSFMLKFIDKYPQKLPVKGGHVENLAKNIIFTSNVSPENWYKNHFAKFEMHKDALMRRMEEIWEFTGTNHEDRNIIKHKTEAGQPSQEPRSSVARGSEDANEIIDTVEHISSQDKMDIEEVKGFDGKEDDYDEWNVGGGCECYYCGEDIRNCKNKCKINLKEIETPTSLSILKQMRSKEWNWMKNAINATNKISGEDMFCDENLDDISIMYEKLKQIKKDTLKSKHFWGHNDLDKTNPHLYALAHTSDNFVL